MSYRSSEIRPGMDVFTFDGVRLGSIIRVNAGPERAGNAAEITSIWQRSEVDGESLGPAPTRDVGNFGPTTQSPDNRYATGVQSGDPLGEGQMQLGTILGMFGRRWLPLDDVQTVSMERVVLRHLASHYGR
jgi:hypothetical protein